MVDVSIRTRQSSVAQRRNKSSKVRLTSHKMSTRMRSSGVAAMYDHLRSCAAAAAGAAWLFLLWLLHDNATASILLSYHSSLSGITIAPALSSFYSLSRGLMLQPDSMFPDAYNSTIKEILLACADDRMDLAGRCVHCPSVKAPRMFVA
jgi:hypothetical protein